MPKDLRKSRVFISVFLLLGIAFQPPGFSAEEFSHSKTGAYQREVSVDAAVRTQQTQVSQKIAAKTLILAQTIGGSNPLSRPNPTRIPDYLTKAIQDLKKDEIKYVNEGLHRLESFDGGESPKFEMQFAKAQSAHHSFALSENVTVNEEKPAVTSGRIALLNTIVVTLHANGFDSVGHFMETYRRAATENLKQKGLLEKIQEVNDEQNSPLPEKIPIEMADPIQKRASKRMTDAKQIAKLQVVLSPSGKAHPFEKLLLNGTNPKAVAMYQKIKRSVDDHRKSLKQQAKKTRRKELIKRSAKSERLNAAENFQVIIPKIS